MEQRKLRRFWWLLLVLLGLVCGGIVLGAEIFLRFSGFRPYTVPDVPTVKVEPGGQLYTKHPRLGYTNRPGRLHLTYPSGWQVVFTNLDDHRRITRPLAAYGAERRTGDGRPQIWLFGASFTYGDSVNDEDTFAYRLQSTFPDFEVVNFAVNGYSNLNSLLQLREALRPEGVAPALALLVYAPFQIQRNTGLRNWQKILVPGDDLRIKTLPLARLREDGELWISDEPLGYREFPLMRYSVLVHFMELTYNQVEDYYHHSRRVTERILIDMAGEAGRKQVPFGVALIQPDPLMANVLSGQDIPTRDISIGHWRPEHNNLPHDPHPSALAHRKYAAKLTPFLRELLR